MSEPFAPCAGGVRMTLANWEVELLSLVPALLDSVGKYEPDPAAVRLDLHTYPDDAAADAEFRRLLANELEHGRAADRSAFSLTVEAGADGVVLSTAEAEAWLRVLTEARLVQSARAGLPGGFSSESDQALFDYLSWLQGSLVEILDEVLP